jgi:transglutaminase-like putative cysteine protease
MTLDSPGPYPRGLAWNGTRLWIADYQTDSLYALLKQGSETYALRNPKQASVTLSYAVRCEGPDPIERYDIYLAIPRRDLPHQTIRTNPAFRPVPDGFVRDKWDQELAHFVLRDLQPGETRRVRYNVDVEISRLQMFIIPESVGSLNRIPRSIRLEYTKDGARLFKDDPVIRSAVEEAVGDETNVYWMVRKIFDYVNSHIEYERVGGWDTAPNVLSRGTGSCSEYSFVFMAMARAAGIPTRFAAGVCERGDEASMDDVFHRWTEVYMPGYGWVPVDTSAGDSDWPGNAARAIGSYPNRILITTIGGGDSEFMGWGYNYGSDLLYSGRTSLEGSAYADWEP